MCIYNCPPEKKALYILGIFEVFDILRVYIDYLMVITKYKFTHHLKEPGKFPQKIYEAGLKVNSEKP